MEKRERERQRLEDDKAAEESGGRNADTKRRYMLGCSGTSLPKMAPMCGESVQAFRNHYSPEAFTKCASHFLKRPADSFALPHSAMWIHLCAEPSTKRSCICALLRVHIGGKVFMSHQTRVPPLLGLMVAWE